MSGTPTQIRRIAELLSQEHESVDALARLVWDTVEELQASRDRFVTVAYHPKMNVLMAVGPYATVNQASKDAVKTVVQTGGTQVRVAKLYDPANANPT